MLRQLPWRPALAALTPIMAGALALSACAAEYADDATGHFYATANRKKLTGPVAVQTWPDYFTDEAAQDAAFDGIVALSGVGLPANP